MLPIMKAVIKDDMSICQASEKHHWPKSTLGDTVSGWVLPGATSGTASYLTSEEEEELVTFVCHVARQEHITTVERILSSHGITKTVTAGWEVSFIGRHPKLPYGHLLLLSGAASDCCTLDNYLDELELINWYTNIVLFSIWMTQECLWTPSLWQ